MKEVCSAYNSGMKCVNAIESINPPLKASKSLIILDLFEA